MNGTSETGKIALALGAGILAGKMLNGGAWWLLGGATVLFIVNSTTAQIGLKKGLSTVRSRL